VFGGDGFQLLIHWLFGLDEEFQVFEMQLPKGSTKRYMVVNVHLVFCYLLASDGFFCVMRRFFLKCNIAKQVFKTGGYLTTGI